MSNSKFRNLVWLEVSKELESTLNRFSDKHNKDGISPSCISCEYFDEKEELCKAYNSKPPARIIAFGCNTYKDIDNIPF